MTVEIREFSATIPAGTAKATPASVDVSFAAREVVQIDWVVPPGPRGELGWAITTGGLNVLPTAPGTWIITDDERGSWVVEDMPDSGAYQVTGYNTGNYDHTIYLRFHLDVVGASAAGVTPAPIPGGDLGSGADQGGGTGTGGTGDQGSPPPITPPPTIPPPPLSGPGSIALPVLLPPALPPAPGQPAPVLPPDPPDLLLGVADLSQVWLLTEAGYTQLADQDAADALIGAGLPAVPISTAMHNQLLAAIAPHIEVELGHEVLSGLLGLAQR